LYIFETRCPQKLTLTISPLSEQVNNDVLKMRKCSFLTDTLHKLLGKESPPDGSIEDHGSNGGLRIFFYKFDVAKQCSNATASHFPSLSVVTPEHSFKPGFSALIRNVAWSFFCLDSNPQHELENDFVQGLNLKPDYSFPKAKDEAHCVDVFYKALIYHLQDKAAHVEKIDNPDNTEHLCQFSGGGDLFFYKEKLSMVVIHESSNECPSNKHPSHKNEHLSGLTMEAKKSESTSNLENQLFANMLLKGVDTFKTKCKGYDESVLQKLDTVLGYGAI